MASTGGGGGGGRGAAKQAPNRRPGSSKATGIEYLNIHDDETPASAGNGGAGDESSPTGGSLSASSTANAGTTYCEIDAASAPSSATPTTPNRRHRQSTHTTTRAATATTPTTTPPATIATHDYNSRLLAALSSRPNDDSRSQNLANNSNSNNNNNSSSNNTNNNNNNSSNNNNNNNPLDDDDGQSISDHLSGSLAPPPQGKLTKNLAFAVLASTVGASFQHGYNGGVVNAPEKVISQFLNQTYQHRHNNQQPTDSQLNFIFALIVSIYCIGGCLGALLTALVADRLGRKEALFYNNVLVLVACPLMASSKSFASYELLIVGRLLIGINAGLNAGLAPLFINEISPNNLRGALGTIYQLIITVSIFLSNVFGMPGLLGGEDSWPFLFAVPMLPAVLMLIALPHCCESPKHLLLNLGRELQAQQALAWFRGTSEVQDEMDDLRAEHERHKMSPAVTLREMVGRSHLRRPLTISIVIMLSQQLSGINAVLFFSTSIFRSAGLGEHAAIRATLGMSLVNVLMTIVSLFLVDKAGRKTLHMTGLMGMAFACLVLGLCLGGGASETPTSNTSSVIAVISVYLFIIMFASGPGSIPWFLVAELFPSKARPLASSIAVAVNWLANFTVSLLFLPLIDLLHGFTFFLFAGLLVMFHLFTYYKVPETKGATSEEISALFKH